MTTANGDNISNPKKINELFKSYYSQLYTPECHVIIDCLHKFCNSVKILSLSEEAKAKLDSLITMNEVSDAIDQMKGGKVPGPDGITMDFYKIFKSKLLSPLFNMLVDSFKSGELPPVSA